MTHRRKEIFSPYAFPKTRRIAFPILFHGDFFSQNGMKSSDNSFFPFAGKRLIWKGDRNSIQLFFSQLCNAARGNCDKILATFLVLLSGSHTLWICSVCASLPLQKREPLSIRKMESFAIVIAYGTISKRLFLVDQGECLSFDEAHAYSILLWSPA